MDWVMLAGWIGPVVGGGVGLLGGGMGTYFTLKNAKGSRERAFAVKATILCWVLALLFVAGMALISGWFKLLLVIPYAVVLFLGIRKWNEIQFRIQKEEAVAAEPPYAPSDLSET